MPLRRRHPLLRIRSTALAVARACRGAAVVTLLAAVVATLVLTAPSHGPRSVAFARSHHVISASRTPTTVPLPDVSRAMRLFGLGTDDRETGRATRSSSRQPLHRWVRPNGGPLSSPFGYRWGRLHAGIDLAGPWGSTIVAATDGCISYAGPMDGYGEVMQIADWDGTETVYGHMSSFIRHFGCVHAGEPIARVGSGGDATGPHLHFEVRVGGVPVNPVPFLAERGLYI
jgi:murein DD-endopeptidase MepM/ murein hydrolase activator NlpD